MSRSKMCLGPPRCWEWLCSSGKYCPYGRKCKYAHPRFRRRENPVSAPVKPASEVPTRPNIRTSQHPGVHRNGGTKN